MDMIKAGYKGYNQKKTVRKLEETLSLKASLFRRRLIDMVRIHVKYVSGEGNVILRADKGGRRGVSYNHTMRQQFCNSLKNAVRENVMRSETCYVFGLSARER